MRRKRLLWCRQGILLFLCMVCAVGCSDSGLRPPESIQVEADGDNVVALTWDPVEGAEQYRIYKSADGGKTFQFLIDTSETSYQDSEVTVGKSYVYRVAALSEKQESEPVASGVVTLEDLQKNVDAVAELKIPQITSVTPTDSYTAAVLFSESPGAQKYEVWKSSSPQGEYRKIGETYENAYYDIDYNGTEVWYKVNAVSENGSSGVSDPVASGTNAKNVSSVIVMMYHEFVTEQDLEQGILFDEYAIYYNEFEHDLQWLRQNGYTTVTPSQIADYLDGKISLPPKAVLLSIDDGKWGVYKNAWPLLKKYGMKASLSVIGEEIDKASEMETREGQEAPFCNWDEIKQMSDSGAIEMISHTYGRHFFNNNGRVGANVAENEDEAAFYGICEKDYLKIQKKISDATGRQCVAMAYPYSRRSPEADRIWRKCGYKLLLAGDSLDTRKTDINFFADGAGANYYSTLLRRVARMTGKPIETYIMDMLNSN